MRSRELGSFRIPAGEPQDEDDEVVEASAASSSEQKPRADDDYRADNPVPQTAPEDQEDA